MDPRPKAPASGASPQPAGQASPQRKDRRRPAMRWIVHGLLFVALAAGVFGLLPRLGGLTRDAAGLRHARPALLASLAGSALTGRAFAESFAFAAADLLFDLLSLDLMFLAVRYQPGFGPLALAYAVANIASAFPITPGGLGVVEVTLVAITVGFGAPRPTAVLAVLGYRIVNYWLPLMPGAIAYLRLRLSPAPGRPGKPQAPPAGR